MGAIQIRLTLGEVMTNVEFTDTCDMVGFASEAFLGFAKILFSLPILDLDLRSFSFSTASSSFFCYI